MNLRSATVFRPVNYASSLRPVLSALAGLLVLATPSCSWFGQQHEPQEKAAHKEPPPIYLGTIDQVYPEKNFALVRLIAPMPEAGTTLISHPADGSMGRVGNLSVSRERVDSQRLAADIRGGTVVRGDYVFAYRPLSEPDARTQEVPEESAAASDETGDDTPLPEGEGLAPAGPMPGIAGPLAPVAAPASSPASSPAPAGILSLPEVPLPPAGGAGVPTAPSPTGPRAPRKAPASLNDIPDKYEDL